MNNIIKNTFDNSRCMHMTQINCVCYTLSTDLHYCAVLCYWTIAHWCYHWPITQQTLMAFSH